MLCEAFSVIFILRIRIIDHSNDEKLGERIAQKAKTAVLIGRTAGKIAEAIENCAGGGVKVEMAESLADAVAAAERIADRGDIVVLSPACASYDMFENFQHRGESFRELVRAIRE